MTTVDKDLIVAWSRFAEAREHVADVLGDIRQPALDVLRDRLQTKYRGKGSREDLAGTHYFGRREAVPVKREQSVVWIAMRVPARVNHPTIRLSLYPVAAGPPVFGVEVGGLGQPEADGRSRTSA